MNGFNPLGLFRGSTSLQLFPGRSLHVCKRFVLVLLSRPTAFLAHASGYQKR